MSPLRPLLLAATLALVGVLAPLASAQAAAPRSNLPPVQGEAIVAFKPEAATLRRHALAAGATAPDVASRLNARAGTLGARRGLTLTAGAAVGEHVQVVRAVGMDSAALARALATDPEVAWAAPNGRRRLHAAPNDPLYPALPPGQRANGPDSGQWYLRAPTASVVSAIDIEAAWARSRGSSEVVVAVLDTGVRFDHPDLGRAGQGGALLPGYDFVSDPDVGNDGNGRDSDPSDPGDWVSNADLRNGTFSGCETSSSSWHGTATASLIGAVTDNQLGMAGAAPGVRVLPVRVLGKCYGTDADITAAMRWAGGLPVPGVPANPNPARILNMSLGGEGACTPSYQSAIDDLRARGVLVVAAAGNSAGGPVSTPANCRGVVSVLALRHSGTKVGFSDLGPEITLAAPGGNCINITGNLPCLYPILAATNLGSQGPGASAWTDSFDITVGTSFSSPLVAAVAGLMVSVQPGLTPERITAALQASARPFPTTGSDNGVDDPTPVAQCQSPTSGVQQLQCYCSTALCGAGMLDAGAAVAAVSGPQARITVLTAVPQAGASLSLSGADSVLPGGGSVASWSWSLVDGGGIAGGFSSATNAATASLLPTGAGTVTVRLTLTDTQGRTDTATLAVQVSAAPSPNPVPAPEPGGGGGGGAASGWWVLGVGLAAAALLHDSRRRRVGTRRRPIQ